MPASKPLVKRKQWTNKQMVAAMKAVEDRGSVRGAARDHGVPYSILKDRVSGRAEHGTRPGPKPYLNIEENELGQFLKNCASYWIQKNKERCNAYNRGSSKRTGHSQEGEHYTWMVESLSLKTRRLLT